MQRFLARVLLPGIPLAAAILALQAQQQAQQQGPEPCFSSTGGPNGDFDWVVRTGEIFFFDTTATTVIGGPNGVPTAAQNTVGGRVEVRNLLVEAGGQIRVQGPNPMRIQASGDVTVRGLIDLSGFNARNVATLNTGNQIELGGRGTAGAGSGGNANVLVDQSSPRGAPGNGPFGELGTGGGGGESGYASASLGKDARRPGGGGGARFGADRPNEVAASSPSLPNFSLVASAGGNGNEQGRGAESGTQPASGGAAGLGAFDDGKPENDFFGLRPVLRPLGGLSLIRGELTSLWAGYGGGGGGNAIPASTFPNPSWSFATDEKGAGGGGGGGTLHVQALGSIVFGATGQIRSNGGLGGTGENTYFLDHVGGTGGSGSRGHVVLEAAVKVDFTDGGANQTAAARDWITGYGRAIHTGHPAYVDPCCRSNSYGGAGGAGVLQLHVTDPLRPPSADPLRADIVVPASIAALRNPLDGVSSPRAYALYPTCNAAPRRPLGWLGLGLRGGLRRFMGLPLVESEEEDPASELIQLELPRRF